MTSTSLCTMAPTATMFVSDTNIDKLSNNKTPHVWLIYPRGEVQLFNQKVFLNQLEHKRISALSTTMIKLHTEGHTEMDAEYNLLALSIKTNDPKTCYQDFCGVMVMGVLEGGKTDPYIGPVSYRMEKALRTKFKLFATHTQLLAPKLTTRSVRFGIFIDSRMIHLLRGCKKKPPIPGQNYVKLTRMIMRRFADMLIPLMVDVMQQWGSYHEYRLLSKRAIYWTNTSQHSTPKWGWVTAFGSLTKCHHLSKVFLVSSETDGH